MSIVMSGIDYQTARVEVRERFSLTASSVEEVVEALKNDSCIDGCILLSTCNRTDLYISYTDELEKPPAQLLCQALQLPYSEYAQNFITRDEDAAIGHLFRTAAGLTSQIRGEDQILTQVKKAAALSRKKDAANAELETLFRCAVTAAKKVKTNVPLAPVHASVAERAVFVLGQETGGLAGHNAIVIGNGEMGRIAASLLVENGCGVTVTVRSYRRGEVVVPDGCEQISYDERYNHIAQTDTEIVISATTSPHHTICAQTLKDYGFSAKYFVDLSVPRDIEPAVENLPDVRCWNVDSLAGGPCGEDDEKLAQIEEILKEYAVEFFRWRSYRHKMLVLESVRTGEWD